MRRSMGCGGPWKPPCVACRLQSRSCGRHCIFAPLFPPGSTSNFVLVVAMYGIDRLTRILTSLSPALRNMAVTFMIREARARSNVSASGRRRLRFTNAVFLLAIQVPRLLRQLQLLASVAKKLDRILRATVIALHLRLARRGRSGIGGVRGGGGSGGFYETSKFQE